MTVRDRTILLVVGVLAAVAAAWFLLLAPKRDEAARLTDQVAVERQRLETAQASAEQAASAKRDYAADYAAVARLGKAVPADAAVPSLVYQLEQVAKSKRIDFRKIKLDATAAVAAPSAPQPPQDSPAGGQDGASSAPAGQSSPNAPATGAGAAGLPPGATVGPAGFPVMPFSFVFDGKFFDMQRFLAALDRLTTVSGDGELAVKGRLLTINGVALSAGRKGFPQVSASVSANAYILPADQGLTAGATASSPAPAGDPSNGGSAPAAPAPAAIIAGGTR